MEHIVQFAIGIDDEAITERVTAHAEEEITKNIQQMVMNKLFYSGYYKNAKPTDSLSCYSERLINEFLELHKDAIIEKTATYLADKLMRSKIVKERIVDAVESK